MFEQTMDTTPKAEDVALGSTSSQEFMRLNHLPPIQGFKSLRAWWSAQSWELRSEAGWDYEKLREALLSYLSAESRMEAEHSIHSLEILPGRDKSGKPEQFHLRLQPGDVVCLVGPTGAGKSRLLADIECMAQGDTPTGRTVLLNGAAPSRASRFTAEGRPVAQITQNMNFVMDLRVAEFLRLHAESRGLANPEVIVERVWTEAIRMAGEPFGPETPLTQLSGGQSRALMIADAAFLSPKPIVLIDEIENAGVDRLAALSLFSGQGKIVLLSTHDPLLAMSGTMRLVIHNGGVQKQILPSPKERENRDQLRILDLRLHTLRERLRRGDCLDQEWDILIDRS